MNPNALETAHAEELAPSQSWRPPAFEVICLACELSAYAPDDGGPLF